MLFSKALLKAFTAAASPSGRFQIPSITARKSTPALMRGRQFSVVMPPIATEGTVVISFHHRTVTNFAGVVCSFVFVGKNAPNAMHVYDATYIKLRQVSLS